MRKISLFLLIFGLIAIGCDSNDDDVVETDAERFEGTWELSSLDDAEGPVELVDYTAVGVSFNTDESFSLDLTAPEGGTDLTLTGTWSVSETAETITLNTTVPGSPVSLPLLFEYNFVDDDVQLIAGPQTTAALNGVLGLALTAPVTFTVSPA